MAEEKVLTEEEQDAQDQKAFDEGAAAKPDLTETPADPKPEETPAAVKPAQAKPEAKPATPEYVQITKEQFANLNSAAEKTASFEQQFAKVFGTLGSVQKIVKTIQDGTPRGTKVEIPKDAFKDMEGEFPELAKHTRAALENALKGMTGTGSANAEIDPAKLDGLVTSQVVKLEMEALDDEFPEWKKIVGAVDLTKNEKPDPANPFRKWLATKDAGYQTKVNSTNSAAIIARSIQLFQKETAKSATPVSTTQQGKLAAARATRIAAAIQPRGDGAPPAKRTEDDEFESGFKAG